MSDEVDFLHVDKHESFLQIDIWFLMGITAWKMSKYGICSGHYFPVFGLNTEIYEVNHRIQSEYRKYGPEKTRYLETFRAVDC